MWGAARRRLSGKRGPAESSRPRCEFLGVYFDDGAAPVYQTCQRPGSYLMTRRCCGKATVLCTRHVKVAKESEWTECQHCRHIALSWEDSAATLERLPRQPREHT